LAIIVFVIKLLNCIFFFMAKNMPKVLRKLCIFCKVYLELLII